MSITKGFGTRYDAQTGVARSYYYRDGVMRWSDNDQPLPNAEQLPGDRAKPQASPPNPGMLNARIKWLEKHIAIERHNCARRVKLNKMHRHTADEIISSLEGIHTTLIAYRDSLQAPQVGPH